MNLLHQFPDANLSLFSKIFSESMQNENETRTSGRAKARWSNIYEIISIFWNKLATNALATCDVCNGSTFFRVGLLKVSVLKFHKH